MTITAEWNIHIEIIRQMSQLEFLRHIIAAVKTETPESNSIFVWDHEYQC